MEKMRKGFSAGSLFATVLGLITFCLVMWSAFFKPTTTNSVEAGATQIVYQKEPSIPVFGCSLWRLKLGVTLDGNPSRSQNITKGKK